MTQFMDRAKGRECLLGAAEMLEALDIPFFLMQGTALGAYRDHGFTPTEQDIDLGCLQEHFSPKAERLLVLFSELGCRLEAYASPFSRVRTIVIWWDGVKIDLVSWLRWKDKRFACTPVHPSVVDPYAIVHEREMLETYEVVDVFGRSFMVPSPIEDYLRLEYGDEWRTPREDHVSRTRVYGFIEKEGIPCDLLDA